MDLLIAIVCILVFLFGFVVLFGAPYVPTLKRNMSAAFDLMSLKPGDTIIEVGSGDGRVLLEAAKRGYSAVGYELNPVLVMWSRWKTRKYKQQVKVVWGNAITKKWPKTQAVYVFGVEFLMKKLYKKITQELDYEVKLVSFGFEIPGLSPDKTKNAMNFYLLNKE